MRTKNDQIQELINKERENLGLRSATFLNIFNSEEEHPLAKLEESLKLVKMDGVVIDSLIDY